MPQTAISRHGTAMQYARHWDLSMKTDQTIRARKKRKIAERALPSKKDRCTVYALIGKDRLIKYVGQTRGSTAIRYDFHVMAALSGKDTPRYRWIASGECGGIVPLQHDALWLISEALWIRAIRKMGGKLFNSSREHDAIYRAIGHDYSVPMDLKITPLRA